MAGVGPQDLHALAQDLLDACIDALDTIPAFIPTLEGAPERTYVSPGQPAFDCCDQLTVHVDAVTEAATSPLGLPQGQRQRSARVNHVMLIVHATRCVPVGTENAFPTPDELQTAAEQINADGWALWNHIFNLIQEGLLFSICNEVFWDGLRSIVPSGGCGGWRMVFRVQLDGYEEALGT